MLTRIVYKCTATLVIWFFRFFLFALCRTEIKNLAVLPDTNFIIASNHLSHLDWILLYTYFHFKKKRAIHFLAKKELNDVFILRVLVDQFHAITIDRDKFSVSSLKQVLKASKIPGSIIGIFPEGTRSLTGTIQEGKPGVGRLFKLTKLPILPVAMDGTREVLPPGSKFLKIKKIKVNFGNLIHFDKERHNNLSDKQVVDMIMNTINKLQLENKCNNGYQPPLSVVQFPD